MFEVFCTNHGSQVLLTTSCIEAVRNIDGGDILVEWRCWCGHPGRSLNGQTVSHPAGPIDATPCHDDSESWPNAS